MEDIGPELQAAIAGMTKGTNLEAAFSNLHIALKNTINTSLQELNNEQGAASDRAKALGEAL